MNNKWITRIAIVFVIMQMMFVWHIDVCLGAIKRGEILTNGFWKFVPIQIYHVSLYGIIILTGIFALLILKTREKSSTSKD